MTANIWSEPVIAASSGSQLYNKACKKCHGKLGQGKKNKSNPSQFKYPPIHKMPEEDLLKAISSYKKQWLEKSYDKKDKRMAKSAGRLSEEEIQAVIAYITAQLGRDAE